MIFGFYEHTIYHDRISIIFSTNITFLQREICLKSTKGRAYTNMKHKKKRRIALFVASVLALQGISSVGVQPDNPYCLCAEESDCWFSQKGWIYNGVELKSLCYVTSYAMVLQALGKSVTPFTVYVANGYSNYCNHSRIGSFFNVKVTNNKTLLAGKSAAEREAYIKSILPNYPQGIIVGGNYGGGTHYVVAKKVVDDTIYFNDPARATSAEGCCIPISSVYKLTWANITDFTIIQLPEQIDNTEVVSQDNTETQPQVEATEEVLVTPTPNVTVVPTATPTVTVAPTPRIVENNNPIPEYPIPKRILKYKKTTMTGEDIKWLETALKKLGYTIDVDGRFSKEDKKVVKSFQTKMKISADGEAGTNTIQTILKALFANKLKKVSGLKVSKQSATQLSKTSSKTMTAFVQWKHNNAVEGYEIVYATNKKFSNAKKKETTENELAITNLSSNASYYIKVRAYITVGTTKVYGNYSNVKRLKAEQ